MAVDKNLLGCICMIMAFGTLSRFVEMFRSRLLARRVLVIGTLFAMNLWLFALAEFRHGARLHARGWIGHCRPRIVHAAASAHRPCDGHGHDLARRRRLPVSQCVGDDGRRAGTQYDIDGTHRHLGRRAGDGHASVVRRRVRELLPRRPSDHSVGKLTGGIRTSLTTGYSRPTSRSDLSGSVCSRC